MGDPGGFGYLDSGCKPGHKFVTPSIEDAEAMQGFKRGWTWPAHVNRSNGPRWKLIGNAVTTGVSDWLAENTSPKTAIMNLKP